MSIAQDLVLRWSNTPLSSLVFDSGDTNMSYFRTRKFLELDTNEVVSGALNNGRKFEHIKWVSSEIQIIISTDDLTENGFYLDNAKMNYLKNWWNAKHKYIGRVPANASLTHTGELNQYLASDLYIDFDIETLTFNYFEVVTGGGLFPLTFINDLDMFPELSLNLKRLLPK
jgi:hypothetical protein